MKFIRKFVVFSGLFASLSASSTPVLVPGVGSVYESTLTYKSFAVDGETNTTIRRRSETLTVSRSEKGRPVFAGEVFGYRGEIIEGAFGTVVYTDECQSKVPQEALLPPKIPNQCGWHVCNAPGIGSTFTRAIVVYAGLHSCKPKIGTYTFTTREVKAINGEKVTIGDAKVYFGTFAQTSWTSHIKDGVGEVYAVSPSRETLYKTQVNLVPYAPVLPTTVAQGSNPFTGSAEKEVVKSCNLVAFGDSLTEGMGATQADSYPAKLGKLLGREVCNMGVSGNTSDVLKARLPDVIARLPKVVFMTIGANDVFQGISKEATAANLTFILDKFKEKGIFTVVLGFDGVAFVLPQHIRNMLGAYEVAQHREDVIFLPNAFVGILDNKLHISSDGIHPNALGYELLANKIMDQLFGLLRVLPSN